MLQELPLSLIHIYGNIIYDLAGSSILIGHPQHVYIGDKGSNKGQFSDKEKYDVGVEGACEYLTVTNNFLSDTSKMFWGDAGVMIFLGAHITYQYNYLQNTPYAGLSLGWGWWNMDGSSGSVVPGEPMTTTQDVYKRQPQSEADQYIKIKDVGTSGAKTVYVLSNKDMTKELQEINNQIYVVMVAAIILTIMVCLFIYRIFNRQVQTLLHSMQQVQAGDCLLYTSYWSGRRDRGKL